MNAKSVISCPRCLRQYEVDAEAAGKLAMCDACGVYFNVVLVETSPPGEAISLTNPLAVRYLNYFHEGVATMATQVRELLELAGRPVTPEAILDVVNSLPRDKLALEESIWSRGPVSQIFKEALDKRFSLSSDPRFSSLWDHLLVRFPSRDRDAQDMLLAAFNGVLSIGMETLTYKYLQWEWGGQLTKQIRDAVRDEWGASKRPVGTLAEAGKDVVRVLIVETEAGRVEASEAFPSIDAAIAEVRAFARHCPDEHWAMLFVLNDRVVATAMTGTGHELLVNFADGRRFTFQGDDAS